MYGVDNGGRIVRKEIITLSIILVFIANGAHAGTGGNGSGNPKNDASWGRKEPLKRFIWRDGKLVPNPERGSAWKKDEQVLMPVPKKQ